MKKIAFVSAALLSLNVFSQNRIQQVTNVNFIQTNFNQQPQVFASNMMVNESNSNKPARANANPQVSVQRATNINGRQQQQRRRTTTTTNVVNTSNVNPPIVNVIENNTDEIQQLANFNPQMDVNTGNSFGNENMIEQIASVNIPAIQMGSGSLNLNIKMPEIKLPSMRFASRKTVSSSKHKSFTLKRKLAKLNRNLGGKFAMKKKLKIKVDNCFKW